MKSLRFLFLGFFSIFCAAGWLTHGQSLPVAPPADARVAAVQVRVAPDRPDWTYAVGAPVKFAVSVTADNQPIAGAVVRCTIGPEMMPVDSTPEPLAIPASGTLVLDGGTMQEPGFLRCIVVYEYEGQTYRGVATAAFSPEKLAPTQQEPPDFDEFWAAAKAKLVNLPLDLQFTALPELTTANVNVYHVSFQNAPQFGRDTPSRIYGILCEPKGSGPFPAVLSVPGAGVRPYSGHRDLAERGMIVLQIGIHGIPVNLPKELYEQLDLAGLSGHPTFNLESRDRYYYQRVYLGCLRAVDALVSRPTYDGQHLAVIGGSQGGQLAIVTAALDPRVTALVATHPAFCDVTGYLHHRAGGWPHMFRGEDSPHRTPDKIATTAYYDTVNFARRLKVPGYYSWGYNDEVCPPTSLFAAYNVITAPKRLTLDLESAHYTTPEQRAADARWLAGMLGLDRQP